MTVVPSNSVDASVLVIGGGPVGLTLAALLARYGVKTTVVEADDSYCSGSRAICVSRRSQEIFGWIGADEALVRQGLPWVGGRSYYKNAEVLHFQMPSEASERFAPMINIQQHRIEAMAHEALQAQPAQSCVLWSTRLIALRQNDAGVEADVQPRTPSRFSHEARFLDREGVSVHVGVDVSREALPRHLGDELGRGMTDVGLAALPLSSSLSHSPARSSGRTASSSRRNGVTSISWEARRDMRLQTITRIEAPERPVFLINSRR